jgi:hypothetical protein
VSEPHGRPYAVAVGQPDIEHRDFWFGQWNSQQRLDGGAGLPDDLDVSAVFQQFLEAASDHVVVVEDEHPGHVPTRPSGVGVLRSSRQANAASRG